MISLVTDTDYIFTVAKKYDEMLFKCLNMLDIGWTLVSSNIQDVRTPLHTVDVTFYANVTLLSHATTGLQQHNNFV